MKPIHQLIAELEREHGMRQLVYTRLIREGKLTPRLAQHRLDCVAEALTILRAVQRQEASHGQAAA